MLSAGAVLAVLLDDPAATATSISGTNATLVLVVELSSLLFPSYPVPPLTPLVLLAVLADVLLTPFTFWKIGHPPECSAVVSSYSNFF